MEYSLAKRLKEAGYQMPGLGGEKAWIEGDETFRAPTLSELIEACPTYSEEDGNFSLTCMGWKKEGPKWLCGYEKYETYSPECAGETPEEAVANLWLALKNSSV